MSVYVASVDGAGVGIGNSSEHFCDLVMMTLIFWWIFKLQILEAKTDPDVSRIELLSPKSVLALLMLLLSLSNSLF